jgi:hypothetical protein
VQSFGGTSHAALVDDGAEHVEAAQLELEHTKNAIDLSQDS